jgi:hypothetical protein
MSYFNQVRSLGEESSDKIGMYFEACFFSVRPKT